LDDMIGGGLDGAGPDGEAVEAEGGILQLVDALREVLAFDPADLGGLRGRRFGAIERREDRGRTNGGQVGFARLGPGGRLRGRPEEGGGGRVEVLAGMPEVDGLDALVD